MMKKATAAAYRESAAYLRAQVTELPRIAIILGSGLSALSALLTDVHRIPYERIPHFPQATVAFHAGELLCGRLDGVPLWVMNGRFHYYEGYEMWQTAYPVGVLSLLGVQTLIVTNAAGGLHPDYRVGDLVCVTDHIKLCADSPTRGAVIEGMGERFTPMEEAYDPQLRTLAHRCAEALQIPLQQGVYAYMSGPQFETPAEIRALRTLGADLCGMSTVAEVIAARQCGIRTLCVSCVTNLAAGCSPKTVSHAEVVETGQTVAQTFCALMQRIVQEIGKEQDLENSI